MNDRKKEAPLTLVADNSSEALEKQRAQQELERSKSRASDLMRRLAVNLLRVIAGAGEPWALMREIDEVRKASLEYLSAAKEADHPAEPLTRELDLDLLFSWQNRKREPVTEEDWHRWAEPSNPHEEYFESNARAKLELRRAVLRQVASVLSSRETREPHLKAHGGNLDDIIQSILAAEKQFEQQKSRPPRQPDPERVAFAEQKIAGLRREQRTRQIESLPAHQIAGLRAVEAGTVEQTDRFTLDVLGSMKLLTRPKSSKEKSEWQLTDEGRLALEIHK
jgi:hypothetical protein